MNKKLILFLVFLALMCILGYNYLYQDHRDVSTSEATASFKTTELIKLFTDENVSNDIEALDQVIVVEGMVTDTGDRTITIDHQIFVEMVEAQDISKGQQVAVKGRCLGYDDLMEEVKIDQAQIQ